MPIPAVEDRRAIDLQPALTRPGKLHLMTEHLSADGEQIDQLGEFMEAQGFQNRFAANVRLQSEQNNEGAIGQLDAARFIEQKQAFDHAVEQSLLLGAELKRGLLLKCFVLLEFISGSSLSAEKLA